MDRRERRGDAVEALRVAIEGSLAETWTSVVGIVQSFDASKQTCTVQPAIRSRVQAADGSYSWAALPLLLDCPVHFPKGGGVSLTFPVSKGDECLVVLADRCIDAWWQSGGIQNQADIRMHDLSDGFAFVGFSSVPSVIAGISASGAELRNDAGTTKVAVNKNGTVNVLAAGNITLTSGAATFQLTPAGGINMVAPGGFFINGQAYINHTHNGVQPGGGNSGGVNT